MVQRYKKTMQKQGTALFFVEKKRYTNLYNWRILNISCSHLLFFEGSVFFESDVGIEFGGTFVAFRDELEADATDLFLGKDLKMN